MLEKNFNHPFLNFEDQFSSISINSEQMLDDHEGSWWKYIDEWDEMSVFVCFAELR